MTLRSLDDLRASREDLAGVSVIEFAFPGPLRDSLVAAILDGRKTATTGLVLDWEVCGDPLPVAGQREILIDSAGLGVGVIELTAVDVRRNGDIDLEIAIGEGEGYTSVDEWRAGHAEFWTSPEFLDAIGDRSFVPSLSDQVVVQWFALIETF